MTPKKPIMRGFTDSDLQDMEIHASDQWAWESEVSRQNLIALLARLRAAERCVMECATDENCCNIPERGENDISPYYLWMASKGERNG